MKPRDGVWPQMLPSHWLLLALIALLPLMKPPVRYPVILADLVFLLLVAALAIEVASGRRGIGWNPICAVLLVYVLSLVPSLVATPDLGRSAFKLVTEVYLVGLAGITFVLVTDEAMLRRATIAWLASSAALALLSVVSLIAFIADPGSALYRYSQFHFGTLPPGHYPRLALTFFNANMACNYLTVSLGLLFLAWRQRWLPGRRRWLLLAGILAAALPTLSPGLGGLALALGAGAWLLRGSRTALVSGILVAFAFVVVLAVTPIVHPTAPFLIEVPAFRLVLAPAARFLTWGAALGEATRHPLVGHGIGVDAIGVRYIDPSGNLQYQTDAHNVILSIAAQAGLIGLAGLSTLIAYAVRLSLSRHAEASLLALTFLNGFVYQGLGGSFEDTRHLWVLLGLAAAAARLPVSQRDENNHRADAPSSC